MRPAAFICALLMTVQLLVVLESRNIALQGTLCTSGSGIGVAVALGDNTVFGRIAKQAGRERPVRTSLEVEITRFVLIIATLAITVSLIIVSAYRAALVRQSPARLIFFARSCVGRVAAPRLPGVYQRAEPPHRLCFRRYRVHPRSVLRHHFSAWN